MSLRLRHAEASGGREVLENSGTAFQSISRHTYRAARLTKVLNHDSIILPGGHTHQYPEPLTKSLSGFVYTEVGANYAV